VTAVLRNALWGYRFSLLFVGGGLFAFSLMIAYIFSALGGLELIRQFEQFIPEAMRALFKAQGGFASDATGFLASDYRHPMYLVAELAFVIALSSGAVAREVERGGILMVLANPIPRWRYLVARILAMVVGTVVILALAVAGTWVGAQVAGIGDEVTLPPFLKVQVATFSLMMAVGGVATLISSVGNDGARATAIATGIAVAMYFVDFLAALWSPASFLGPVSFFHYYDPQTVAESGLLPWRDLAVLHGAAAATFAAALLLFQRRDIAR